MSVGCTTHTARVVDRITGQTIAAPDLLDVAWTRVLDDTSQATATLASTDPACCAQLGHIRAWRHRLDIWRGETLTWSGPIISPEWTTASTAVTAVDVLGWLDRRVPHVPRRFTDADLADIAAWLIRDGYAPDDPGHTVRIMAPSRVRGDREYHRDIGQTGDHLRDLADTGLDYTAVAGQILLLPEDWSARVGALSDDDFPDGLEVVEDGAALATRWIVHGADDVRAETGGHHQYYGLLEQAVEETSILDTRSALSAARSRLRASIPVPVWIDSSATTLAPDAPVSVTDLVPGWCLDITTRRTCRELRQSMKIVGVRVQDSAQGEQISVQLLPASAGDL